MHPIIQQILRNPAQRMAIERALAARGNKGDSLIAHINPQEAGMLKQMGGSGTINPKTGLLQFDAPGFGGSGNSGGYGGGNNGGFGNGGQDSGGKGNGSNNAGSNQGSGGYTGTHASGPGFGSGPTDSPSGGYGQYGSDGGYNGGVTINSGKLAVKGIGALLGPIGMAISTGYGLLGPNFGPSLNIGGTTNGYSISGDKTGVYGNGGPGGGWGSSGGPNNAGGNVGANGGGQHNGPGGNMGNPGSMGNRGAGDPPPAGAPGTTPAPAVPPAGTTGAGLPPGVASLIAQYLAQMQGDPFKGRFGLLGNQQPYQIGMMPSSFPVPRAA